MTSSAPAAALDHARLEELLGRFVNDLGAAFHAANAVVGDRLGLYEAVAETGPASAEEVAARAGCDPRLIREWLRAQAAGGYVTYEPESDRYSLSPEQAFALADPNSSFAGFDIHEASVEAARKRAAAESVADRVCFEVAAADAYLARELDLVTIFDAFHDMGDPAAVARHALASLRPDGTLMLVEPRAADRVEENFNPVGRLFYNASALICVPNSVSQDAGAALGAQAGEARLREVLTEAGFTSVRRAAETPFNAIFEARP
jgi:hypothetical protein